MPTRVVVIGAGLYGIAAAKTYLQVDPDVDLTVLDEDDSVGGTWSRGRIYPGLLTQQAYGVYEYADMPIDAAQNGSAFIPADRMSSYLHAYCDKYAILPRIRFNKRVVKIRRSEDSKRWDVWTADETDPQAYDKVVVATGLTSNPNLPRNLSTEKFSSLAFHTKDLGKQHEALCAPEVKHVLVYGGGKSAIDCITLCVRAGKTVDWVIRPDNTGNGVRPLLPAFLVGRSNLYNIASSRIASYLTPSIYSVQNRWHSFFNLPHRFGNWLQWTYWGILNKLLFGRAGFKKSENMAKLKPKVYDHGTFWINPSIITEPEVREWIHDGRLVKITRGSIVTLQDDKARLSTGESIRADALVYATGYAPMELIFTPDDAASLGVSVNRTDYPHSLLEKWDSLEIEADEKVVELFPRLASPPAHAFDNTRGPRTPWRLYKNIVPPMLVKENERSLVFVGVMSSLATAIVSEVTALWAVAWLTDNLDPKVSAEDMEAEVALRNAFARRRYLGVGKASPLAYYEFLPIVDLMLGQLGIEKRLTSGISSLFTSHQPRHYRGLVDEWLEKRRPK